MKKVFLFILLLAIFQKLLTQEVLRLKAGSSITVQSGTGLYLEGGITLDNGSILINNGTTSLKNNFIANQSEWKDQSFIGALGGAGLVIFNSDFTHEFWGPTQFYNVRINSGGLALNHHFNVQNQLHLVSGKINTGANYVFLSNSNAGSLLNDVTNTGYVNSWINGNFRRTISANLSTYDFPVGNSSRPNLLQFLNNNISGTNYLTSSFGTKPGTDAGLNVTESGVIYTAVNNGGVWFLEPDFSPSSGNYSLHLHFNGFSGLLDNQFGILKRPATSSNAVDWIIPPGSSLEPVNGLGRKVSDGFARRTNISDFSQLGIGMFVTCEVCTPVCTYTHGFYSNPKAMGCTDVNGSSSTVNSTQIMLNAFGPDNYQVFGNIANRRYFTLFRTDISNGNIFKMLPGFGNAQPIAVDNISPLNGAYYSDKNTWYLVPIENNGPQKGKIKNLLLSQLMILWFNLRTSSLLGTVDLTNDTLVTIAQTDCGSGIPAGLPVKFGLPHNIVVYLNGGNGYANNVNGLYQLANDVLGGANHSVSAPEVQQAVAKINEAFDRCRILVETIPYSTPALTTTAETIQPSMEELSIDKLSVRAYPNPYHKDFSLEIVSPVNGLAVISFYSAAGSLIHRQSKFILEKTSTIVPYSGPLQGGALWYSVSIGSYKAQGMVIGPN